MSGTKRAPRKYPRVPEAVQKQIISDWIQENGNINSAELAKRYGISSESTCKILDKAIIVLRYQKRLEKLIQSGEDGEAEMEIN